jgi:UPF0716 protein FxsA
MLRVVLGCVFVALPLIELAVLVKTGQAIGFWATMGIVVGTGLLGAHILMRQGWTTMRRMQEAVAKGQPPVAPVIDGAFLVVAGALLITPGLISDAAAILLLIPPVRRQVARWLVYVMVRQAQVRFAIVEAEGDGRQHGPNPSSSGKGPGPVIEGEFERMRDEEVTGPHRREGQDRI